MKCILQGWQEYYAPHTYLKPRMDDEPPFVKYVVYKITYPSSFSPHIEAF